MYNDVCVGGIVRFVKESSWLYLHYTTMLKQRDTSSKKTVLLEKGLFDFRDLSLGLHEVI